MRGELRLGGIKCEQIVIRNGCDREVGMEFLPLMAAAMNDPLLMTSTFNQDSPHGGGGGSEKMAAVIPLSDIIRPDQSQVSFMHQGRGIQRLVRPLVNHPRCRELAQLIIDERQQLVRCLRIAGVDGEQYASNIGHSLQTYDRVIASQYPSGKFIYWSSIW